MRAAEMSKEAAWVGRDKPPDGAAAALLRARVIPLLEDTAPDNGWQMRVAACYGTAAVATASARHLTEGDPQAWEVRASLPSALAQA